MSSTEENERSTKNSGSAEFVLSVGLALLIWALPGCIREIVRSPLAQEGAISGAVTDRATADGLPGIAVTLEPSVAGMTFVTDEQGAFLIRVPPGTYQVTFTGKHHRSVSRTVAVPSGRRVIREVNLEPKDPPTLFAGEDIAGRAPGSTVRLRATIRGSASKGPSALDWQLAERAGPLTASIVAVNGAEATIALADPRRFKDALLYQLETEGRLLDRWMVLGLAPSDVKDAGAVIVTVSTGGYHDTVEVRVDLSSFAAPNPGLRNVPVGNPVLVNAATRERYAWALESPAGSAAMLADAETRNPHFTPDVPGTYRLFEAGVTRLAVVAGRWWGAIVHRELPKRPRWVGTKVEGETGQEEWKIGCVCHYKDPLRETFDAWNGSGHAEIFIQVLNYNDRNGEACFLCHTVGFDRNTANRGIDEAPGYTDFLRDKDFWSADGGALIPRQGPGSWARFMKKYPKVAQFTNVQCENCHGPNDSEAHTRLTETGAPERISVSALVCGSCHEKPRGDPSYRQWQATGHANYRLALETSTIEKQGPRAADCGRCHSAQGFLAWVKQRSRAQPLQGADGDAEPAELAGLGLTVQDVEPTTCPSCHDPHAVGSSFRSGLEKVPVRVGSDTPVFPKPFGARSTGREALCLLCHSTENEQPRGEATPVLSSDEAPHAPQGDMLMGVNGFFVEGGRFNSHARIEDSCIWCHLKPVPEPPASGGYSRGGARHNFRTRAGDSARCHDSQQGGDFLGDGFDREVFLSAMAADLAALKAAVEDALLAWTEDAGGVTLPTEAGAQELFVAGADIEKVDLIQVRGRMAAEWTTRQGVLQTPLFAIQGRRERLSATPKGQVIAKTAWNYLLADGDRSRGAHNPGFVAELLFNSLTALETGQSAGKR